MKEQFVTYEIALKLKELGFDEECLAIWGKNPSNNYIEEVYQGSWNNLKSQEDVKMLYYGILSPLWQQVIDWLFNKYGFIIYYSNNDWSLVTKNESFLYNELPNSTVFQKWEKAILKAIELITPKQ